MPRVTIKSLQEELEQLKSINKYQSDEINKLRVTIEDIKKEKDVVSKEEYDNLVKQFEPQRLMVTEYKRLYEDLRVQYNTERSKYISEIESLEKQVKGSETKLNERNAGRKAYSNKEVIEMIYNFYIDGKSLQRIADELNRSGIRTNRNKDWSKSSIRFILLNSKNVTNGFIEEDKFKRSVELLNDNKK
ncbi:recombinase family protein [Clostridium sporogenes]|uniref:recombinase family protein n=1 Tax=Clostridium sporogenes TaxID=1509 RepID=UPI003F8E765C